MSPIAAEQLHAALTSALDDYRKQFGAIPKDPKFELQTIRAK
jgi:hypothetical protein